MKILIVEDIDSISLGIQKTIQEYVNTEIVHAKYCDDGLLKFKRAVIDNEPFDLIITDLSFKSDYKEGYLKNGDDLIEAVRKLDKEIPIVVYSIEDKTFIIKNLFELLAINAYVLKGRNSTKELKDAIKAILKGEKFISKELNHVLQNKNLIEIDDYDLLLLHRLASGNSQTEISNEFEKEKISPSSVSAIEKRINKLKIQFQAKNTIQLIVLVKDLGII